ncbi:UPF0276 protein RB0508 [Roseibium aquae]|uniref:UPF0276 protein GCM10011316_00460 n=1 Tax=Roseibium aquae TaxID=1323746 RepID=A0A916WTW8_9HYPH|nr:DUF692 domain-containing protein [Roseibium aquae]GGB32264.1 UPF0276 protein RB0508 [Roseibium aquae]
MVRPKLLLAETAGAGLKAEHAVEILRTSPEVGFFEIHAENYMGAGGAPHRILSAIRDRYPVSLHGVGLSIGAEGPLDRDHLCRLKALNDRYQPALFSEHLAWSTHDTTYFNDLLPVPYTEGALRRVCDHIDEVQNTMGRRMLLENPSTYVAFSQSTMTELDFLREIVVRTGCGLLLDVNNVFVSCTNHEMAPEEYLSAFPLDHVDEIHLGGHAPDTDSAGRPLLIDTHDREVDEAVWALFRSVIDVCGPVPTLIEWDNDVPPWPVLCHEVAAASKILRARASGEIRHAS